MSKSKYYVDTLPKITKNRSKFPLDRNVKTSLNVGNLVPLFYQEVLPGDTFSVKTNIVSRLTSAWIKAPLDNLMMHVHYIYTPNRLVWERWAEFLGENKKSKWANTEDIRIPKVKLGKVVAGSVANYLGIPIGDYTNQNILVNALPFRAFALCWNEWFRDQNNQDPVEIEMGNNQFTTNTDPWSPTNIYGMVPQINKFQDYFTSALPDAQKGDPVTIAIGDTAPVITGATRNIDSDNGILLDLETFTDSPNFGHKGNSIYQTLGLKSLMAENYKARFNTGVDNSTSSPSVINENIGFIPRNLYADLRNATAISINELREKFQLQKLLEKEARGGTRLTEIISYQFGVDAGDARLQRPEFLGGETTPIEINQVPNTAGGEDATQGSISGYSLSGSMSGFNKSFVEHGILIAFVSIRQKHSYQQALNKYWMRDTKVDFYNPTFANLGEQPIHTREIFINAGENDIFGLNEIYADYRYAPDMITGQMSSLHDTPLDNWHFGDLYENAPVLGDEFIKETNLFVDRAIAVQSTLADQFILDAYVKNPAVRVMPRYGVPGLIDHN